jgi:D-sedoheptulose 7-phosphate isomerase
MHRLFRNAGRHYFIGNGGSAAIASHMAVDWTKNGGKEAIAFNDASALTCVANDYGYEQVFSKQIEWHAKPGDILVAISSSGRSVNIINAVIEARSRGIPVVTLSGFTPDNPLREMGQVNFWIDSKDYGIVELSHAAILHSMIGK